MYKVLFIVVSLLLTSCVNSPTIRGASSTTYGTRDAEVVFGEEQPEQTYPRIALVIGNNDYQRNRKLINAVSDARAVRDFLINKNFRVVYAENANRDTMKSKINEFMSGLGKKSVAIIYYAGHASQDRSQDTKKITNYLVPINDKSLIDIPDYDKNAISFNYILNKANARNNGLNIAMLDACRTPIGRGGLIENIGAEGVYLVYSTASGTSASDSGEFRKSFLKYANQPLKLTDIFGKVKLDLRDEGQRPSIQNDIVGNFYFSKPTPKPIVKKKPIYQSHSTKGITIVNGLSYQNQPFTKEYHWQEAKKYCQELTLGGYRDWRLPTKSELMALGNIELYHYDNYTNWEKWYDKNKHKRNKNSNNHYHFIKKEFIENMPSLSWFWTSEKKGSSSSWIVYFYSGNDFWSKHSGTNYALCVR